MRRVGLAWNVIAITPERQAQKLAGAAQARKAPTAAKAGAEAA
jgi:hypothetical protein